MKIKMAMLLFVIMFSFAIGHANDLITVFKTGETPAEIFNVSVANSPLLYSADHHSRIVSDYMAILYSDDVPVYAVNLFFIPVDEKHQSVFAIPEEISYDNIIITKTPTSVMGQLNSGAILSYQYNQQFRFYRANVPWFPVMTWTVIPGSW